MGSACGTTTAVVVQVFPVGSGRKQSLGLPRGQVIRKNRSPDKWRGSLLERDPGDLARLLGPRELGRSLQSRPQRSILAAAVAQGGPLLCVLRASRKLAEHLGKQAQLRTQWGRASHTARGHCSLQVRLRACEQTQRSPWTPGAPTSPSQLCLLALPLRSVGTRHGGEEPHSAVVITPDASSAPGWRGPEAGAYGSEETDEQPAGPLGVDGQAAEGPVAGGTGIRLGEAVPAEGSWTQWPKRT